MRTKSILLGTGLLVMAAVFVAIFSYRVPHARAMCDLPSVIAGTCNWNPTIEPPPSAPSGTGIQGPGGNCASFTFKLVPGTPLTIPYPSCPKTTIWMFYDSHPGHILTFPNTNQIPLTIGASGVYFKCSVGLMNTNGCPVTDLAPGYALTITKSGTGSGTVTASGASVANSPATCGTSCAPTVGSENVTTLTASAATGSKFSGWGGACSGTSTSCALTITSATAVSAKFNSAAPVLNSVKYDSDTKYLTIGGTGFSAMNNSIYIIDAVSSQRYDFNNIPATVNGSTGFIYQQVGVIPAGTYMVSVTPANSSASNSISLSIQSKIVVVAVGGILTFKGSPFFDWIDKTAPNTVRLPSGFGLTSVAKNTNALRQTINEQLGKGNMVLVIGWSLGSAVAYNVVNEFPNSCVAGLYVDPPYRAPLIKVPLINLIPFLSSVKQATWDGFKDDPNSIIWTNGAGVVNMQTHNPWAFPKHVSSTWGSNQDHLANLAQEIQQRLDDTTGKYYSGACSTDTVSLQDNMDSVPNIAGISSSNVTSGKAVPGDTISIVGSGFGTSGNTVLMQSRDNPNVYYDMYDVPSSDGKTLSIALPSSSSLETGTLSGTYDVYVSSLDSDWSSAVPFTVQTDQPDVLTPTLSLPQDIPVRAGSQATVNVSGPVVIPADGNTVRFILRSPKETSMMNWTNDSVANVLNAVLRFFFPFAHGQTVGQTFVVSDVSSGDGKTLNVILPANMPAGIYDMQVQTWDSGWSAPVSVTVNSAGIAPPVVTPPATTTQPVAFNSMISNLSAQYQKSQCSTCVPGVSLHWSYSGAGNPGFVIDRTDIQTGEKTSDGNMYPIGGGWGSSDFAATRPSHGYTYCVTVAAGPKACGANNVVSILVPPLPLPPVLTAKAVSASEIDLSWKMANMVGISSFTIYDSLHANAVVASTTGNAYVASNLPPATKFCYTIQANTSLYGASKSSQACATTKLPSVNLSVASPLAVRGTVPVSLTSDAKGVSETKLYVGKNLVSTIIGLSQSLYFDSTAFKNGTYLVQATISTPSGSGATAKVWKSNAITIKVVNSALATSTAKKVAAPSAPELDAASDSDSVSGSDTSVGVDTADMNDFTSQPANTIPVSSIPQAPSVIQAQTTTTSSNPQTDSQAGQSTDTGTATNQSQTASSTTNIGTASTTDASNVTSTATTQTAQISPQTTQTTQTTPTAQPSPAFTATLSATYSGKNITLSVIDNSAPISSVTFTIVGLLGPVNVAKTSAPWTISFPTTEYTGISLFNLTVYATVHGSNGMTFKTNSHVITLVKGVPTKVSFDWNEMTANIWRAVGDIFGL